MSKVFPLYGKLYQAISKRIPSPPPLVVGGTNNFFFGEYKDGFQYSKELEILAQETPVPCDRCRSFPAWYRVRCEVLAPIGYEELVDMDLWDSASLVCKQCFDELKAEAKKVLNRSVKIVSPAPGYDAVSAWLLTFYAVQFTPGFEPLTLKVALEHYPFFLSDSIEVFGGLKQALRKTFAGRLLGFLP